MLIVLCDVPSDMEEEFNRWWNEEHLAERLTVPGVLSAARYEAISGGPKHLTVYELESPDVIESKPYQQYHRNPTEWSKRMAPGIIGTNFFRNVYQMIHPAEATQEIASSPTAPVLQIGRMDVPRKVEPEWNQWYNNVYVPNYEQVPGVIRGRRFKALLNPPKYMTFYEFDHEEVSRSEQWLHQQTAHPDNAYMRSIMEHTTDSPGIWKKTFEIQ